MGVTRFYTLVFAPVIGAFFYAGAAASKAFPFGEGGSPKG